MGFWEQVGAGLMRGALQVFSEWALSRKQRREEGVKDAKDDALLDLARDVIARLPPAGPHPKP